MLIPAAQYLRMSTENQQYSLENQSAAIKRYADKKGFEIVQTYEDVAKSGGCCFGTDLVFTRCYKRL